MPVFPYETVTSKTACKATAMRSPLAMNPMARAPASPEAAERTNGTAAAMAQRVWTQTENIERENQVEKNGPSDLRAVMR